MKERGSGGCLTLEDIWCYVCVHLIFIIEQER